MPIHGYPGNIITANPTAPTVSAASGVWTTEQQLQYQTAGNWPMAATQISRSLRFNSADSAYLNRTPSSASGQQIFTLSAWVKRGTLSTEQVVFGINSAGTNIFTVAFLSGNTLRVFGRNSGSDVLNLTTTAVYRDPSAWYHIVVAIDTTQATSSNRARMYVNGVEVTAFGTATYPAQNTSLAWNSNSYAHDIGRESTGNYFNGYVTEINHVSGSQLTPSSFGQTNASTGVWEPRQYTGPYGTNGFYLNFSDNSGTTSTTLGKDYSGNGNNWTPNNFSVTAGTGNDSLVDTPTSYGTDTGAGGEVRGNYCTADVLTPQGSASGLITVANGNLQLSYTSSNYAQRFGNFRVNSGKWYYEWTVTNIGFPSLQCGWFSGQAYPTFTGGSGQATGGSAVGYFGGSTLYVNTYSGGFVATTISSQTWSNGDVIMVAVDFDAGKIWFGKNGSFYSSGNPASGTNPIDTWTASSSLNFAPWFVAYGTTTDTYVNFGQRAFSYTAPSGFKALCTQNLPTPTIGATSTTTANKYFDVSLYTGNGTSQSITNSGSFQPDLVWVKKRDAAASHNLVDAVRGTSKTLFSNLTDAEDTTNATVTAFNSNGFTVGSYSNTNSNGNTFVGWQWNAGGSNATNTSGTITSTVRANTTAGFSIVTYTGNATTDATIGHGLGVTPQFFVVKNRSTTSEWLAYHVSTGKNGYMQMQSTAAFTSSSNYWGSTGPTSTTIQINGGGGVNNNGSNYVCYAFAPVAGYSAFGSYTGNGSTDGPFIFTGFRPRFILVKCSSGAFDWHITDTSRSPYNQADTVLFPNSSAAETNGGGYFYDLLSNGFKCRNLGSATNGSGATYIYAAFAENPFKYSLAR